MDTLKDASGRPVRKIRISVTEECNLRCHYCHGEGQPMSDNYLSIEEIEKVLATARSLGIQKVKITGGEPLCRKDIVDIVGVASEHLQETSLTTNGTLMAAKARELKDAGLDRVNISLDTLDKVRYKKITGSDKVEDVLNGIRASIDAGLYPVKVNIVFLHDTSIDDLMETTRRMWELGAIPQIIEMVGSGADPDLSKVEAYISSKAVGVRQRQMHKRKIYKLSDGNGKHHEVELVRPVHNSEFCANCSTIRLTSGGLLKPCLMHNKGLVDILTPIRDGANGDKLAGIFKEAIDMRAPFWKND